jgi:hypothetical protein
MTETSFRIEGPAESLEGARRELLDAGIEFQPVGTTMPGELREPILAELIVNADTGAALLVVERILARLLTHRERMAGLRIYRENSDRELSIAELEAGKPER